MVAKSSTSFSWGKDGKVTTAGWQVTLCNQIWHVISRSGVVISITNCYIRFAYILSSSLEKLNVTLECRVVYCSSGAWSDGRHRQVSLYSAMLVQHARVDCRTWHFPSCFTACSHRYFNCNIFNTIKFCWTRVVGFSIIYFRFNIVLKVVKRHNNVCIRKIWCCGFMGNKIK